MNRALILLLALGLGAPAPALANSAVARAKAEYAEGVKAFRVRNFEVALGHFERAFKLDSSPVLLYNLARCHEELGNNIAAVDNYELYLARAPDAADRTNVEERVRLLRIAQAREEARAKAARARAKASPTPNGVTDRVAPAGDAHLDWWGYGLVGVGAAGLVYGLVQGVAASDAVSDHEQATTNAAKVDAADAAESAQQQANLGYAVGAALVLGGVGLLAWDAFGGETTMSVTPTPGGAGFVLGGHF